jgi:hypothetical protein
MQSWDALEPVWREAFRLAWKAFAAGTIPVGAVVTRDAEIIARNDPLEVDGPLAGPFGLFGELLHIAWFVGLRPEHRVTRAFRERVPELVSVAERLRLHERAGAPLEEALPQILDELGRT